MDSAFIQLARKVFLLALDLPGDARDAFVDRACADDAALRALVRALLRHAEDEAEADARRTGDRGGANGAAQDSGGE